MAGSAAVHGWVVGGEGPIGYVWWVVGFPLGLRWSQTRRLS